MIKEYDGRLILGDKYWWVGLTFLIFIVFIIAREFLIKEEGFVLDPLYIFSVLMVGFLIAAPILWIFNDGKRLLIEGNRKSSGEDSDLFESFLSLPDRFRTFKDISIKNEKFDVLVIGSKTIFVIGIYTDKEKKRGRSLENLFIQTKAKEKILNNFLKNKFTTKTVLVSESNKSNSNLEEAKINTSTAMGLIEPSAVESVLVQFDSHKSGEKLPRYVLEELEKIWKREDIVR